jgi:ABC-2 type transport system permease protein
MLRALEAMTSREVVKFWQQRGRLLSALVRPTLWLVVFAAGFQNVFGVSIIPPYKTYILYQDYIVPGLLGIVLLFHGMQSSLSMVYDREMGTMRLLLTAPLPRAYLLLAKLIAGTSLSIIQAYIFLFIARLFDVDIPLVGWITVFPAFVAAGLMLGALGLLLSVHIKQLENFAGTMNFVIFPMFFISPALYPLWKLRESGAIVVYWLAVLNPFTYCVELVRFALYGMFNPVAAAVVVACGLIFFWFATIGYDPQRGMIRRAPGPA